ATVYEKGAEVVRMYDTLLGSDGFRRGMDLYFERHDGRAVTCDDFRRAMADANGADLEQFARWYCQVGTPKLEVAACYEASGGRLELTLRQSLPDHPDNSNVGPLLIPVKLGLLAADGRSLKVPVEGGGKARETHLIDLREAETTVAFTGLQEDPVVSLLRGFSAPVAVEFDWSDDELACLSAFDPDPVARWMAARSLAGRVLARDIARYGQTGADSGAGRTAASPELLIEAWRNTLARAGDDPALAAELLQLPSEAELAREYKPVPVDAIHTARTTLRAALATALAGSLRETAQRFHPRSAWRFTPDDVAGRRLANSARGLLVSVLDPEAVDEAVSVYRAADNMTDRFAALAALVHAGADPAAELLADFERRHGDNPLVMDKWFAVQARVANTDTVELVERLMRHPAFSLNNPNKVRALVGIFGLHNPVAFHRVDGAGYRLLGDVVAKLDDINPQVAARLVAVFNRWADYDETRALLMREQLESIRGIAGLSPDVDEIVSAALR
ncbi:MAG: DUF3458 domain-containing protein, partial [Wenzhouxiangellaceae bacterium]|nr:DUF3458 domain-containing protein [Wenzhouxiangellaceae bacterium]